MENLPQDGLVLGLEGLLLDEFVGHGGHPPETFGFGLVGGKVGIPVRIEQPEPGKVARQAQLGGRGREEQ